MSEFGGDEFGEARARLLHAAFGEFYLRGFQGGSLARVVEIAGLTKGALFHYFRNKDELGLAVIDEVIGPLLLARWLEPLRTARDPVMELRRVFRELLAEDLETSGLACGCPLNNLAQEMSPLDERFRERINGLYDLWRAGIADAIRRGKKKGTVRKDVDAEEVAAFAVAAQMGIWGTAKSSQRSEVSRQAVHGLCGYFDSLRAKQRSRAGE